MAGTARGGSAGSLSTSRMSSGGAQSPVIKSPNLPTTNVTHGRATGEREAGSPTTSQSTFLPGYRDALFGNSSYQQTLAWRDNTHVSNVSSVAHLGRITNNAERRSGHTQLPTSPVDPVTSFGMQSQAGHRTGQGFSPPPLLTSESTAGTTISSLSNTSSSQFMPRTPLEPSLDRPLAIPPLYPSKPYENQLPPLRSISLSPQTSMNMPYNSPSGKIPSSYLHSP